MSGDDPEDAEFARQGVYRPRKPYSTAGSYAPLAEIKNRERCWLWCFALDRSWSVQVSRFVQKDIT